MRLIKTITVAASSLSFAACADGMEGGDGSGSSGEEPLAEGQAALCSTSSVNVSNAVGSWWGTDYW